MTPYRWIVFTLSFGFLNWLVALVLLTTFVYGIDLPFDRKPIGWYHFGIGVVFIVIAAIIEDVND